uniref:Uncharacterized protein n=1 Tax=Arundo donax TaxID=35708 RepID=A0A0A9FZM0_ARUDO
MFLQVAPSPTTAGFDDKAGFSPFTEYYYGKLKSKPAAVGRGSCTLQLQGCCTRSS